MSNDGTHTHAPCCSSHRIDMYCAEYRRTHFVEARPCCADDAVEVGAIRDAEWLDFQAIPNQGYSHRHWLDTLIRGRIERERAHITAEATVDRARIAVHQALAPRWGSIMQMLDGDQSEYDAFVTDITTAALAAGYRKHPEPEVTDEACAICGWSGPRTQYLGDREENIAVAHPDGDHRPDWLPRLRAAIRVPVGEGER